MADNQGFTVYKLQATFVVLRNDNQISSCRLPTMLVYLINVAHQANQTLKSYATENKIRTRNVNMWSRHASETSLLSENYRFYNKAID